MLRAFNIIRVTVFVVAILFSFIVLGVAAHLNSVIEPNELTRFIPVSIFCAISTIVGCACVLWFGSRERFWAITETRWELGLASLLGVLWFSLGLFLSIAEVPDLECPDEPDGNPSPYTDEMFHAQYHTLQAFSILNALILLGYCLWLLVLAMRHSYAGRKQVWNARVNEAQWFLPRKSSSDEKFTRLPAPVSSFSRRRQSHWRNQSTPETVTPSASASISRNASNSSSSPLTHTRSRSAPAAAIVAAAAVPTRKTSTNPAKGSPPAPPSPPTPTTKPSARGTTRPDIDIPPTLPPKARTRATHAGPTDTPQLAQPPPPRRRAGTLDRRPSAKNQQQEQYQPPARPSASRSNTYAYMTPTTTTTPRQPAPPRSYSNTNTRDPSSRRDRTLR
ncbi:uncharacterized protein EI90DRAFT_1729594 [Cantharellus anzutake]|uniref:uncharacterized protein n=1 Tax=Cantharellus anzutake TaxID=1750568 RepID=UPI0019064C58|nr:uncharacterized protein EI90DRAFT_1729594 [Cantharellus anzutake]KAF8341380.1 hypothetical protein EI90DRAFT_1729594 [Cantharellus anzutake]